MADNLTRAERDLLKLRSRKHQIFISSQMKRGTLIDERHVIRDVINRFDTLFEPWDWEHNGPAGPRTPMDYCLDQVRQSYALVLIVGRTLTDHTHREYRVAKVKKKHLFVFFKKGLQQREAFSFRKSLEKKHSPSWREYQNTPELESLFYASLQNHVRMALDEFKVSPATSAKYKGIRP